MLRRSRRSWPVAAPLTSDSPHLCRSTVAITDAISTDLLIAPTDQWGCMVPGDLDHRTDDLEHAPGTPTPGPAPAGPAGRDAAPTDQLKGGGIARPGWPCSARVSQFVSPRPSLSRRRTETNARAFRDHHRAEPAAIGGQVCLQPVGRSRWPFDVTTGGRVGMGHPSGCHPMVPDTSAPNRAKMDDGPRNRAEGSDRCRRKRVTGSS
jgi:hypothetical protein